MRVVYPSHHDCPISPSLLRPMADAMERLIAGDAPTSVSDGMRTYDFGEIGVYLFHPRYDD